MSKLNTILCIISLILLAIIAITLIVKLVIYINRCIKMKHFKPEPDKCIQIDKLNNDIRDTGFQYDCRDDVFFSRIDAWQRPFGYCSLYDDAMALTGIIADCEPICFDYNNKHWLIELWKGQYGITAGAEVGVYNTSKNKLSLSGFNGYFYECISSDEFLPIRFELRKEGTVLFSRSGVHWWLTGFRLGEYISPSKLSLYVKICFPTRAMCTAFTDALIKLGYDRCEFSVRFTTVCIKFNKPHSPQPASRTKVQEAVTMQMNENNVKLYEFVTKDFDNTLDKLEFLKSSAPEIYELCINSIYHHDLYKAYKIIKPAAGEPRC